MNGKPIGPIRRPAQSTCNAGKMRRREFIGRLGLAAAALRAPAWIRPVQAASEQHPNILVIISDEHDPAVTGCYGDPIIHTPNLDRLSAGGVVFENCYTNSPLCVPSRLSFLAGRYCSRVGAWNNSCWLPSDEYPTLPRILNAAGYESYLGGKMHLDKTRRYGFQELYPASTNASKKTGRGGRRTPTDESVNADSWAQRSADFRIGDRSNVMDHDRQVTRFCTEFLTNRKAGEGPFFLLAGYLAPHFPLIVPQNCYDPYKDRIAMPPMPEGYLDALPLNYKHLRRGFGVTEATPEQIKMGRECYWALTHWFDTEVGILLSALERSAVSETTMVVYTSDHGENKGDHGLWWKNCMFEPAAHIPLIIRWPTRWPEGARRSSVCSMVDVAQTILQAAGAEAPENWNGRSLIPTLDDPAAPCPDFAISEYYAHNIASGFTLLRKASYKYVYHSRMDEKYGPERELYDLQTDPRELTSLAGRPEYKAKIEGMHNAMVKEIGRDPDETELICRADYAQGYSR
jgi:choline-sulfatase